MENIEEIVWEEIKAWYDDPNPYAGYFGWDYKDLNNGDVKVFPWTFTGPHDSIASNLRPFLLHIR